MNTQIQEKQNGVHTVDDAKEQPACEGQPASSSEDILTAPDKKNTFYRLLSEIQAELEDLQSLMASIRKGQTIIPDYGCYIETTKSDLGKLMADLWKLIEAIQPDQLPKEIRSNSHTLRHLKNAWEKLRVSPLIDKPQDSPKDSLGIQHQLHSLDLLDEQIHTFQFQISRLSIPHQINELLENTGPGYYIPFHEVFAGDVPDKEDRDELLKYIALTPCLTSNGFVDVDSGRIYRYSTNGWRRMLRLGMLLGGLALATGLVALSPSPYLKLDNWPPREMMLVAWVAVLIGMVVHVVVGNAKRTKTQNGMPPVLLNPTLIIDARFGEILKKIFLGLLGLFGLVIIPNLGILNVNPTLAQATPLNAFFVGYSLDSILELFGSSLEGTSQVKGLIKK